MTVTSSDISFTYSGGTSNSDPDLSLGGDPSVQPILSTRLFNDVTDEQSAAGMNDFRCIYLHNNSADSDLYSASILISYTVPGDVSVQLGFNFVNERQDVVVTNYLTIVSGYFILSYSDATGDYDINVPWNASLSTWSSNFQTAIQAIPNLENVTVTGNAAGSSAIFEVNFLGTAGYRFHESIILKTGGNHLLSSGSNISVVKTVSGSPVNSIAGEIDVSTTIPNNITFTSSQTNIGVLRALDSVPIWIKRIVPINTSAIENDGFTLKIKGDAIAT